MPTFCRHNRFVERCPVCSRETSEREAALRPAPPKRARRPGPGAAARAGGRAAQRSGGPDLRVRREARAGDDGYRSELVPGLRASADAERLAEELAFAAARLLALASAPPGLYGEIRERAAEDLEGATWACFLLAYLSPAEGEDPFAGIRAAIAAGPPRGAPALPAHGGAPALPDLEGIVLGPRSSHDPARGPATLLAYLQWVQRGGASAAPSGGGERHPPRGRPPRSPATPPGRPRAASSVSSSDSPFRGCRAPVATTCW